jgi:hypothetical protein
MVMVAVLELQVMKFLTQQFVLILFSTVKNHVYRALLAKPRAQHILTMCLPFSSAFIMSNVTSVQADLCCFSMGLHQKM